MEDFMQMIMDDAEKSSSTAEALCIHQPATNSSSKMNASCSAAAAASSTTTTAGISMQENDDDDDDDDDSPMPTTTVMMMSGGGGGGGGTEFRPNEQQQQLTSNETIVYENISPSTFGTLKKLVDTPATTATTTTTPKRFNIHSKDEDNSTYSTGGGGAAAAAAAAADYNNHGPMRKRIVVGGEMAKGSLSSWNQQPSSRQGYHQLPVSTPQSTISNPTSAMSTTRFGCNISWIPTSTNIPPCVIGSFKLSDNCSVHVVEVSALQGIVNSQVVAQRSYYEFHFIRPTTPPPSSPLSSQRGSSVKQRRDNDSYRQPPNSYSRIVGGGARMSRGGGTNTNNGSFNTHDHQTVFVLSEMEWTWLKHCASSMDSLVIFSKKVQEFALNV